MSSGEVPVFTQTVVVQQRALLGSPCSMAFPKDQGKGLCVCL